MSQTTLISFFQYSGIKNKWHAFGRMGRSPIVQKNTNGLSFFKYLLYKNYALKNFLPDMFKIIFYKGQTGIEYINPVKLIISNFLYPNFYLSIIYFFFRKITFIRNVVS